MKADVRPLGELCDVRIGRTPPRARRDYWGGTAVWVTIAELNKGEITDSEEHISDKAVLDVMPDPVEPGTLLFSFKLSIGKMAVAGVPLYTNEAIAALPIRDPGKLDRDFLRYALMATSRSAHANLAVLGAVLNKAKVQALPIPLPPIDKQRRIVDLLCRAENIARMRREAEAKAKEIIPALFLDMFGDPATNPKGWCVQRLGDVSEVVSGVAKGRKLRGKATRSVTYLRVANVQAGRLDLRELKTIEATPEEIAELKLRAGDVLLTEGGDYDKLGRGALLEEDIGECIHQNHVFRVRASADNLLPEYFASYLQADLARHYFLKSAKRTTNLASINMTQLRSLPVVLPPLAGQRAFARRFADCRSIERGQAAGVAVAGQAFQSLLAEVFGEGA